MQFAATARQRRPRPHSPRKPQTKATRPLWTADRTRTFSDWARDEQHRLWVPWAFIATSGDGPTTDQVVGFAAAVDRLRHTIDGGTFGDCVSAGAARNLTEAVRYAQHHVNRARQHQP